MATAYPNQSNTGLPDVAFSSEMQPVAERLEIIAQPYYKGKLRYRSDYDTNKNRRGVLQSQNNSNYRNPTIRIPECYRDLTQQYYIRVCLVTVVYDKTNCRYIHPYELENIDDEERNDKKNNAVWFPIQEEDVGGIKSFANLRIVKIKADDLKDLGDLRVFDSYDQNLSPQLSSVKDTIKEYNLERSQLAFSIGKKINENDQFPLISFSSTTTFSEEMIENITKEPDFINEPTESSSARSNPSSSSSCRMYKYAPRSGFTYGNDEVLIFFTSELKVEKYGDLQVTFELNTPNGLWSEPALHLEVKDQMVSFKTPAFPFSDTEVTSVDIHFRQRKRVLQPLKFSYVPLAQCPTCQMNALRNQEIISQNNPNKRPISTAFPDDEETDAFMPVHGNQSELRESNSEPETLLLFGTTHSTPLPLININDQCKQILDKLGDSIESVFINNDFTQFLRICRPFIRKRPELLHNAISKNHSDLIVKFIPIASIDLLREKNQHGETVLFHAARLNRVDVVKALLEKENSYKLLEDFIDDKKQNIFHVLALNTNVDEILDLLINHLLKNSIDIRKKFDRFDQNTHTPLQLAISHNNLSATHRLLKYFNNNLCKGSNRSSDIPTHLSILHEDFTRIVHVIDEEKQSNYWDQ